MNELFTPVLPKLAGNEYPMADLRSHYDVVIIGGGPAGAATAIRLRQKSRLKVLIVEAGFYNETRIGESVPPDTRSVLETLGLWNDFLSDQHAPCLGSCSSWGSDDLGFNDFLVNPHGSGWHLNRRKFDDTLLRVLTKSGADIRMGTRFVDTADLAEADSQKLAHERSSLRDALAGLAPEKWPWVHLRLKTESREQTVACRYVIDASGMRAVYSRRLKIRRRYLRRFTFLQGTFEPKSRETVTQLTLLEAVRNGWWYLAGLPDHNVVVAFATNAATLKRDKLTVPDHWLRALAETTYLAPTLSGYRFLPDRFSVHPSLSFLLEQSGGAQWLAVGDAMACYDPISSQGIYKALTSAIAAADAVCGQFSGSRDQLVHYDERRRCEFFDYQSVRQFFYGQENRWPEEPFWREQQVRE